MGHPVVSYYEKRKLATIHNFCSIDYFSIDMQKNITNTLTLEISVVINFSNFVDCWSLKIDVFEGFYVDIPCIIHQFIILSNI